VFDQIIPTIAASAQYTLQLRGLRLLRLVVECAERHVSSSCWAVCTAKPAGERSDDRDRSLANAGVDIAGRYLLNRARTYNLFLKH